MLKKSLTILKKILLKFDKIDILINGAGINSPSDFFDISIKEWNSILSSQLTGTFLACQIFGKHMLSNKKGSIINIASNAAEECDMGRTGYASSKAALIAFTKVLSKELGHFNIRVNAIAPGFIQTEMTERLDDINKEKFLNTIPLKCFGKPEDVANLVSFLASDDASYITGQTINIDGGIN